MTDGNQTNWFNEGEKSISEREALHTKLFYYYLAVSKVVDRANKVLQDIASLEKDYNARFYLHPLDRGGLDKDMGFWISKFNDEKYRTAKDAISYDSFEPPYAKTINISFEGSYSRIIEFFPLRSNELKIQFTIQYMVYKYTANGDDDTDSENLITDKFILAERIVPIDDFREIINERELLIYIDWLLRKTNSIPSSFKVVNTNVPSLKQLVDEWLNKEKENIPHQPKGCMLMLFMIGIIIWAITTYH